MPPTNRLADSSSPYLLQHAHNPVQWRPWGPEAFDEARRADKPIFLSVGYSTCHWCHVMAHESFEDNTVAQALNDRFVCVKVDREELPDVDEQYMLATQLMTGRGGWPNSVVLTPDLRPWFAGTYYPKQQFLHLLHDLANLWKSDRSRVENQADRLADAIRQAASASHTQPPAAVAPPLSARYLDHALDELRTRHDPQHGGFGDKPKFPPHGALAILIEAQGIHGSTPSLDDLNILGQTLDAMASGGIYDHLAGGFHRYATDERWFLPHFEKMLYDNAQLLHAYTAGYNLLGEPGYKRVVAETFGWLQREMTHQDGGFYSALDADSEGEEGRFYLWSLAQIEEVLGDEQAAPFAKAYNATRAGNHHDEASGEQTGDNILHRTGPFATRGDTTRDAREKLLIARAQRTRPHLDDKVITAWNGMMICALARAGRLIPDPRYTEAAKRAADFILQKLRATDGRLARCWRAGKTSGHGYLDDYAYLIDALLELHESTRDETPLVAARSLAQTMIADFHDSRSGGFFSTSARHDKLITRTKEVGAGGNMPGANGVAASSLLRLALLAETEPERELLTQLAAGTLLAFAPLMWRQSHSAESLLVALAQYLKVAHQHPDLNLEQRIRPAPGSPTTIESAASAGEGNPVSVSAFLDRRQVAPGDTLRLALRINIAPGFHIYGPELDPELRLTPTSVDFHLPAAAGGWKIVASQGAAPKTINVPLFKRDIPIFEGQILHAVALKVPEAFPEGDVELTVVFKAQPCNDNSCQLPVVYALDLPITVKRTP